ncbi:hypothetical protein [Burkholderia sp. BCC1999]|uniref:hypothetical protein n=1 Tax=Burkholderia sp. BCC1999 TaxID=2817448 RepID=UPI002AC36437|nr:hypothetical protein [Burkholderia sp. BCC1999]
MVRQIGDTWLTASPFSVAAAGASFAIVATCSEMMFVPTYTLLMFLALRIRAHAQPAKRRRDRRRGHGIGAPVGQMVVNNSIDDIALPAVLMGPSVNDGTSPINVEIVVAVTATGTRYLAILSDLDGVTSMPVRFWR